LKLGDNRVSGCAASLPGEGALVISRNSGRSRLWLGASIATIIAACSAGAAYAADDQIETVVVTGFKESLERALDIKRNALDSSDTILAEDIGKFPDLNLSESIQRIPGVALARNGGEGRQVQVRGLSALFTRVRINGMEAMSTVGSEDSQGGTNRTRAFDFNVFSSDLFNSITVHKSASAELEEGSLGATVDLHTAHPLDFDKFTLTASVQGGYSDQSGSFNPRGSALIADQWTLEGAGQLGILFSVAAGSRNVLQTGFDTTRFENDNTQQPANHSQPLIAGCVTNAPGAVFQCTAAQRFGSVVYTGANLPGTANTAGVGQGQYRAGTGQQAALVEVGGAVANGANFSAATLPNNYDVINETFGARFPRYDLIPIHEKRIGFSGSIQWQPDEATMVTLDFLGSDFGVTREEMYMEANSFSLNQAAATNSAPAGTPALLATTLGRGAINITGYTIDPTRNNFVAVQATNVGLRAEHRLDHLDTRFAQGTLDVTHDFGDNFKVHGLIGWSESHHNNPVQTTLTIDYNCTAATAGGAVANCAGGIGGGAGSLASPFVLDFTNSKYTPVLSFGNVDPTSTTGWFLSQIRERTAAVYNSFRTISGDADWKPANWLDLTAGFDVRNYGNRNAMTSRSNGANTNLDSYIPAAIEATPLSSYIQIAHLHGLDTPPGTAVNYIVPDINKASALFHIFDQTVNPAVLSTSAGACAVAPGCGAFLQGTAQFGSSNGNVVENDLGFWLQAGWDTTFAGHPFRGNIGGRYVQTDTSSTGVAYNTTTKAFAITTVNNSYDDFLPSLNAVFEPADDFLVRVNASQVMTRPNLTALLPGVSISQSGANPVAVTTGNPTLKPYRAKTADLSFEWYYSKGALVSAAFFYKKLDNIEVGQNLFGPFATNPLGIPSSVLLSFCGGAFTPTCNDTNTNTTYTTTVTQKGGPLYGLELDIQQPFDFLPQIPGLENAGFLGNVTFVQARQNYILVPATATSAAITTNADLNGLSRTTWNATLYYDDQVFQARVSAAYRSKFLITAGPTAGLSINDSQIQAASLNIDVSGSYKFDENFTIEFQGINLTNQPLYQYNDSIGQRPLAFYQTGAEYFVGLRYNY